MTSRGSLGQVQLRPSCPGSLEFARFSYLFTEKAQPDKIDVEIGGLMSTQIEPLLTIADIETMPEDGNLYEVIEGELFVSKAPSLTHQQVSLKLSYNLQHFLFENPIGTLWPGPGVIFSEISGVIPDLVYVSNERVSSIAFGEKITGAPDLVIEIVSSGQENEKRDRVAKRQLYGKYGVKEYWIVDLVARSIEVYMLQEKNLKYHATYNETDNITSPILPGFSCRVADIFR